MLTLVQYRSPLGPMWAYVTPDPHDGRRHPAVVWAYGGFDFSITASFFAQHGPPENDQSARGLIDAGLIVLFASYRGWHDNPGQPEMLLGEVDDYLAAADYMRALPYVDPDHLYLAGHSTGGSIVALAAGLTDKYRAAFSFSPIGRIEDYGMELRFDVASPDDLEWTLRSPAACIADVRRPIWITAGAEEGNARSVRQIGRAAASAGVPAQITLIPGADHFTSIGPAVAALAAQIKADIGPTPTFSFDGVTAAR